MAAAKTKKSDMKKWYYISMIVTVLTFAFACEDTIPFRYMPSQPDSLATRQIPHAFFIVNGTLIDSLTEEPIPELPLILRSEDTVFTNEEGAFSAKTIAFPTSQEFRLLINPHGKHHNPLYAPETLYVNFMLPTFNLAQGDILEYGAHFFGRTYMTVTKSLTPLVYE
jgi:hypothetical protein